MQVVDLAQFSGNNADYIDDITGDGGVLKDVLKPGSAPATSSGRIRRCRAG